ncbi:Mut7-C RNAse domain-containing protein [Massilia sp. Se16.2.3]|uniref:Mut7-C RNAse domain-containing protein n=1 Tax=Massilia sp. Se16.2.3 TaxID=2709303 RepID=UPI00185F4D58|nr:Mut7-C RNAse domain-containing protein [Massilia sp. Se16.2.3]QNA99798.1 Mut7-C ubiquitin/RNAse domain-containing protein [Massilia sp. Se16.2.3]
MDTAPMQAPSRVTATFRFYDELGNFLPRERRGHAFAAPCARAGTTKHMIEALGVPHTEVALILVNGESSGLDRLLADGDQVSVYPRFSRFDVGPVQRVRTPPPAPLRFVADAHLGALARLLRMTGFDTLYDNAYQDDTIVAIAAGSGRVILTRDRELLKRRGVQHGCYLHAIAPDEQLRELFARFDLAETARPFTLCLHCNLPLRAVDKASVLDRLPESVRALHHEFTLCDACGRVFWKGSHHRRMAAMLAGLAADPPPGGEGA